MHTHGAAHAAFVQGWLERSAPGLSRAGLVDLFERAMDALWQRTHRTLGEITLAAVADRVLCVAAEKHPTLAALRIETSGIVFDQFRGDSLAQEDAAIREAMTFVLVEFLNVLGNLTDQILTPALYEALSSVAPADEAERGTAAEGTRP